MLIWVNAQKIKFGQKHTEKPRFQMRTDIGINIKMNSQSFKTQNSKQYVDATHNFVRNPPEGTLTKIRNNGDTLYYNPSTNIFAIKNADGTPRTMFKPNPANHGYKTNLEYFNAQK